MKRRLTEKDRKQLKYSTRIGYIFGAFIFIPTLSSCLISKYEIVDNIPDYLILIGISLSILIMWLINRKWWIDLKNNEKEVVRKIITKKESKEDYAAGSSVGFSFTGKESKIYTGMKSYMEYSLIIENVRYKIEQELWEKVNEKEEVEFHYAPKSKFLIGIFPK
ncbi:MAG: hypothetical protein JEY96_16685 [Bacteroidales bacterium]|nr:hypothetical protein [Bacteroidales bacterium]